MMDYPGLNNLIKSAEEALQQLSKTVLSGLKPPPGPYALFHHCGQAIERLQNCDQISRRLYNSRESLTHLHHSSIYRKLDRPSGEPYPPEIQDIFKQEHELNSSMKLDMESLFIFGGILLDQWALIALYVSGIDKPEKKYPHPFHNLVNTFEKSEENDFNVTIIYPIWITLKSNMLWLDYQIRHYRNKFIVHSNRASQRGTIYSVGGDKFQLTSTAPAYWLDDEKLDAEIRELFHCAPEYIKKAPDDYWETANPRALLHSMFYNIGNIDNKGEREKVANLFGKAGGSTPTFQIIGENIIRLVYSATNQLIEIAKTNIGTINLGRSHESSKGYSKLR